MTENQVTVLEQTFALKVGKNTRSISVAAGLALGLKQAAELMRELGFQRAVHQYRCGNFKPALDLLQFAAAPAQFKAATPASGKWTRSRVLMLVEMILDRKAPEKGWSKRAQVGRALAVLIQAEADTGAKVETPPAEDATVVAQPAAEPLDALI
jgi:hypothetical protein